jgi:hypothetical protein
MRIKSFTLFKSVSKETKLFESVDTDELLSIVKDMLSELDFNDIGYNAVIRRMDGREFIRVIISKPTILHRFPGGQYIKDAFTWSDVKGVMNPIIDFLSEEGFEWFKNRGTLSFNSKNEPNVVSTGSAATGEYKTKTEMWFLRI